MNLIVKLRVLFAVLWLAVGAWILATQATLPPESTWAKVPVGGAHVSLGWLALVLGLYNAARWWAGRALRAQKEQEARLAERTGRPSRPRRPEGPPPEPDPNFDFSDPPAGPPPGG